MAQFRKCTGPCGQSLPEDSDHFYRRSGRDAFQARCIPCTAQHQAQYQRRTRARCNARTRAWNERNREKLQDKAFRKNYGISRKSVLDMLSRQNGECAICSKPVALTGKTGACVDHDHSSGRIRGILCARCNIGLGAFQDNVDFLKAAAYYLAQACLEA